MSYKRQAVFIVLSCILLAVIACAAPGAGEQPTADTTSATRTTVPTLEPLVATSTVSDATPTEAAGETPAADAPVEINPCTLLTADQIQSVLGEAVTGSYLPNFATCRYEATSGLQLFVFTAQGQQAKDLTMQGLRTEVEYLGDENAQTMLAALEPQVATLSHADLAVEINEIEAALGATVSPAPELGETGFWVWKPITKIAHLGLVRGDQDVSLTLIGSDFESAKADLLPLMQSLLAVLPNNITLAPGS